MKAWRAMCLQVSCARRLCVVVLDSLKYQDDDVLFDRVTQ
jgi:hypothetical protein